MAEYPLIVGSGVAVFDGVGLFVGDDGLLYHQDSDMNRIPIGAALAGAVVADGDFLAVGHASNNDGDGGGYSDTSPPVSQSIKAPVNAWGPAAVQEMSPGNFAFAYDAANGQILFTALDHDGNVWTGAVALEESVPL